MFKVLLDYPAFEEERKILDRMAFTAPEIKVQPVIALEEILHTRKLVDQIHVDEKVRDYIVHVVFATRKPEQYKLDVKHFIQFGASPRATIFLTARGQSLGAVAGPHLCHSRRREEHRPRRACATASFSPTKPRRRP